MSGGFHIGLAVVALFAAALALAHGGGLDANGGHTDRRTGEYHQHRGADAATKSPAGDDCAERPDYSPKLDVRHMQQHGWIAPYSCRTVADAKDVDIEHIVAWAETRRSGLSCNRASEFMNDLANITVAYPQTNRHEKSDKDAARWLPAHNRCWFANFRTSPSYAGGASFPKETLRKGVKSTESQGFLAPSCPTSAIMPTPQRAALQGTARVEQVKHKYGLAMIACALSDL